MVVHAYSSLAVQLVHSPVALTYNAAVRTLLGVNLSLWDAVVPQSMQMEGTASQVFLSNVQTRLDRRTCVYTVIKTCKADRVRRL